MTQNLIFTEKKPYPYVSSHLVQILCLKMHLNMTFQIAFQVFYFKPSMCITYKTKQSHRKQGRRSNRQYCCLDKYACS